MMRPLRPLRPLQTLRFLTLTLIFGSTLAGCATDDTAGDEVGESGTETATESESGTTAETGTSADTSTTETTTETTDSTTETTETTDSTTETTDTTTDSTTDTTGTDTTTGGDACAPAPGDDVCTSCLKDSCCAEVTECYADPDCACMADCVQGGGDLFGCAMDCGVMGFPPALQSLGACTQQSCGNECGL
ncbi:hypothetical protein ACNOYE_09965 [Nannocystaceae bacterium ST9]